MVSVSVQPIGSWLIVAIAAAVVTALTLWAYLPRLRATTGGWRWLALGLRLAAILLCLVAALRPSIIFREKQKQPASIVFLVDDSSSMKLQDEVGGKRRYDLARQIVDEARMASKDLDENLSARFYAFDKGLREYKGKEGGEPAGHETAIGSALLDAVSRESGVRVAQVFLISDGSNNFGVAPLVAARQLKGKQIPIVTVGLGSESAGANSRDLAIRDLTAGPTVFVKNQLQVKGTLLARGFANQTVDLELIVEGQEEPVARQRVRIPEGSDTLAISGLKYVPQNPGERLLTLRVKPRDGELVTTNNEMSTFVNVLKGGLNVLFIQGPRSPWEKKYLMTSLDASQDIAVELRWLRKPPDEGSSDLKDDDFVPQRFDAYILSDLPANFLTVPQQALLARAVEKGAGLIMLGGRSSFGEGGWAGTEVARVLPVNIRPGDGQFEPEGGVRFVPNPRALDNYLMQVGTSPAESARIWEGLPPLSGINHLGTLKERALLLAQSPGDRPEPIMVSMDVGEGRSLAFGGETWVWARSFQSDGRSAHRKLWRQIIFWLAHKENQSQNDVKLTLDTRRVDVGQKLGVAVTARDDKGAPIADLKIAARVESDHVEKGATPFTEPIDMFAKNEESRGTFIASQSPPGVYKVSVVASKNGREIGRDSARFLVYSDDRELENPAANRSLLRQLAEASSGESIAPEKLVSYLRSLKGKVYTETYNQQERKVWDNWPFLLTFTTLLVLEWFIRKRHGLV